MADLPVTEDPQFSETMEEITTKDRGAPDTFNPRYQKLLDNDNYLKKRIDRNDGEVDVVLTAAEWVGDEAPYSQTVIVEGITENDKPLLFSMLEDGAPEDIYKAYNKAFGIIASGTGTTADGSVTFKVYKKPEIDIRIGLKGVQPWEG